MVLGGLVCVKGSLMSFEPDPAWVEAARIAAAEAYEALGSSMDIELHLPLVAKGDAAATNSRDHSFLDSLERGEHLNATFLLHAQ